MVKNKLTRLLAMALALVCLVTAVGAANLVYDKNGDGKTNVWDLQLLAKEEDASAALVEALGGHDELHAVEDGVYEIYTALGLYNMAKLAKKGYTFKLMNDIDLGGADWKPIPAFKGNLYGNGNTISNFTITTDVYGSDGNSMGFFAVIDHNGKDAENNNIQSVVEDLHIENANLVITEDMPRTFYVGALTGSNRGLVKNCTAVSVVTDKRTVIEKISDSNVNARIGALIGRNNNSKPAGCLETTNCMPVTENTIHYTNSNPQLVASKMAMNFTELSSDSAGVRLTGVAAYSEAANITAGLLWQDISNSGSLVSETLQERREKAAEYMYDMGTVYWRPDKDLKLMLYKSYASVRSSTEYPSGSLYRGIPYNHGSSSMERFEAWVNNPALPAEAFYLTDNKVIDQFNKGKDGEVETTIIDGKTCLKKLELESGKTYNTFLNWDNNNIPSDWVKSDVTGTYVTGFARYIGNDCSSAATWAWRTISAVITSDGYAQPNNTANMFPSPRYTTDKSSGSYTGIVPVGGIEFADPVKADGSNDTSSATYGAIINAAYEADPNRFLEALSQASMADCLMGYHSDGGHTLMLMGDAVTIRKNNGKIDPDLSYVITTEQGGSYGTRGGTHNGQEWTSSWGVNEKRTFAQAVRYGVKFDDTFDRYFPITIDALHNENSEAATAWCKIESGTVKSNFHINSTTVGDQTVYTKTTLAGSRSRCASLTTTALEKAHGDNFTDTVIVNLANGESYTANFTTGTVTKN